VLAGLLSWAAIGIVPAAADFTMAVSNGTESDSVRAAAADYEKLTGIKIEFVQAPYASLFEQEANAGATQSGIFDLQLMDDPWIPFFAENGMLEDLTPYFAAKGMAGPDNDFLSKSSALCRNPYNTGKFVCVPYVGAAQLFFYDPAKFTEVGLDGTPKTWDELLKAATDLTNQGGGRYFGYVFRGAQGNPIVSDFMPIFWSYGADVFNADRSKVTIDTPEALNALNMFLALKETAPKGVESYAGDEVGRAIAGGTAASSINWPNWAAIFEDPDQSRMVGKIAAGPIPNGSHVGSSSIGNWTIGILTASKHKQEAFDFMMWATSQEQMKISAERGNPPVRFSVFTDPDLTSQDRFRYFPALMNAINFSTARPRHPKWPEIENALGIELSKALTGAETPENALKNAQASVEAIVAR